MIGAVVRAGFLGLRRDRGAWVLSFVVPIAFFSVFAIIFGQQPRGVPRVRVAVADEDRSEPSRRLVAALGAAGLEVLAAPAAKGEAAAAPYDRASAEAAVRGGEVAAALVVPRGFGAAPLAVGGGERVALELLADGSDPVAPEVVAGLLQKAAFQALPDALAERGLRWLEVSAQGLTPAQREGVRRDLDRLRASASASASGAGGGAVRVGELVAVERRDVVAAQRRSPYVSFYAAGIGVLFLLFAASGAGGALLEELESGTLDRVLATRVSMTALLLGKLAWITLLALGQLVVMFTWGALVFHLEFIEHLGGFVVMAIPTALAAAAFGLVLATASRTRAQLGALSTLVILTVSALGGSMYPRFLMSEGLQRFSLFAFNAWALDGFIKVFWREEPVSRLLPQVAVLLANAAAFFAIARRLARRWDVS